MNKKIRKIIKSEMYSVKEQLKHLQNKVFILNESVFTYEEKRRNIIDVICDVLKPILSTMTGSNPIDNLKDVKEALADVMVILKVIQLNYNISNEELKEIMNSKIDKQLKEVESDELIKS